MSVLSKQAQEALRWCRKAAEQDYAVAQNNLGVCYRDGQGVAQDFVEAVKWFSMAARQNYPPAQFNLGVCYASGQGVAQDYEAAVKWYRKAAEQNHPGAQSNLGLCYDNGDGVTKDGAEAVRWYRKAAELNHAFAQFNLGVCYRNGEGVTKDEAEAYKWYLLAAAQGDKVAKEVVSTLERQLTRQQLAEGQKRAGDFKPPEVSLLDTPQSPARGQLPAELRAKAATGNAEAQNELGEAFNAGKLGAVKNAVEAVKWFRWAAAQNLAAAQSNLGLCYERGDGVAKYEVEAYKWYLLAAAQGDTKAKRAASLLELLLSPEEIAEGKRRAQAWLEQRKQTPPGR